MATVTELYAGSASIGTTEFSLPNNSTTLGAVTDEGVIQLELDLGAMVNGDAFTLTFYSKVRSGGTLRPAWRVYLRDVQDGIYISESVMVKHGWDITLDRTAGADRTIEWSIRTVP